MSRLAGRVTFPGATPSDAEPSSTMDRRSETAQDSRRNGNQRQNRPTHNTYRNQDKDHEEGNYRQNRTYRNQDRHQEDFNSRQDRPQYRNQEDNEEGSFRQNRSYRNQDRDEVDQRQERSHQNQYRNQDEVKPRGKGNVRYQGNYSDRFQQQENRQSYQNDRFERRGSQEERQYSGPSRHQERDERPRYQKNGRSGNYQKNHQRSDRSPVEQVDRKPTARVEDVMPTEELLEVEDVIEQISDLTARSERSAAQIKRNIMASNDLMELMDDVDWEKVCLSMISTGLEQGEPEFIADLMVALFKYEKFSKIMSEELMYSSSKHVMEGDDKPLPGFLSAILCAYWPRQQAKAFSNVNPILYTIVCIIKGWIEVVKEDTENFHKEEKKPKYQSGRQEEEEDVPEPEEPKEKVQEEPELVNKCAIALSDLCDAAQKPLWTNWMELTDEIYQCLKPAITHNKNIEGDVKGRLLDTFIQMNGWTKTRQVGVKHNGCQTVSTGSD